MAHICGCYAWYDYRRHYLPQVELSSHTLITPLFFTTKLTQTFANILPVPTSETRYAFPLYDGVSVSAFTCTVGGRIITGRVEEKQQARQTYNDAVERGETAGLLESLPSGIFAIALGNIPANTDVIVSITYGGELKHDAEIDGLRYTLPTSIAPRYGKYPGELVGGFNASASRGIHITVDFNMGQSTIRKIQSPSKAHPIALSIGNCADEPSTAASNPSKASVTLVLGTAELSTDFVLQILVDDISIPKAILADHPTLSGQKAIMATLVPKFKLDNISPEIVFIADQSGSMAGGKNRALVSALKTFLKSLPIGVRFNICAFGSRYGFLWEQSQPYTKDNLSKAAEFVEQFGAQHGGTEMFEPVKEAFKKHLTDLPLELFLLTDGEIWRESELIQLINTKIRDERVDARVFTLGIGGSVSHTLIESVARAGNGFSQFVTETEPMDKKILRMLKAALYPHISDCKLEIEYADGDDDFEMVGSDADARQTTSTESLESVTDKAAEKPTISLFDESADIEGSPPNGKERSIPLPNIPIPRPLQAPHKLPALLPWTRTTAYLLCDTARVPEKLTIRGTCSQGPLELVIPIQALDYSTITVHTLAARAAVHELEEGRGWLYSATVAGEPVRTKHASCFGELVKREGVRLSVKYQVASKWASFVAVENGTARDTASNSGEVPPQPTLASNGLVNMGRVDRRSVFFPNPNVQQQQGAASSLNSVAPRSRGISSAPMCRYPGGFGVANNQVTPPVVHVRDRARFGKANSQLGKKFTSKRSSPVRFLREDGEVSESEETPQQTIDTDLAKVRQIIALQDFDGYWEADNAALYELLGIKKDVVEHDLETELRSSGATALVLYFLETKMQAWKDVWEMVAAKASQWLVKDTTEMQREFLKGMVESVFGDV